MPNFSIRRIWKRKSVNITEYDPSYRVIYLGNVLTGWAKGEGCVEKPLATLWRNYCQSNRPDIGMKVTICGAGLKALTKEHGLTEYWAHRVTYCVAHPAYPKVFCWVYRHEGRRLKQELRCHAVLCSKHEKAEVMSSQLKERLNLALEEFRREKAIRQNARLSVLSAVYDTATFPMRKVYLVTGVSNYRPPLERSKSAPKLSSIEELREEEEMAEEEFKRTPIEIEKPVRIFSPVEARCQAEATPERGLSLDDIIVSLDEVHKKLNFDEPFCNEDFKTDLIFYENDEPEENISPSTYVSKDLGLLDSLVLHNREDSVTSDQPESIGSHSCNSSCVCDSSPDEANVPEDSSQPSTKKDIQEEDNISEESGYSEAKDCNIAIPLESKVIRL